MELVLVGDPESVFNVQVKILVRNIATERGVFAVQADTVEEALDKALSSLERELESKEKKYRLAIQFLINFIEGADWKGEAVQEFQGYLESRRFLDAEGGAGS